MQSTNVNGGADANLEKDSAEHRPSAIKQYALNLEWTFGYNKDVASSVKNLSDGIRKLVLYASGNTGVLYDYAEAKQHLLQGHVNFIRGTATSSNCRWVCTGDSGPDSMVIIWDTMPYMSFYAEEEDAVKAIKIWNLRNILPLRSLYNLHNNCGIAALDFSADGKLLVTLGADSPQTLSVWRWMEDTETPLFTTTVNAPSAHASHHSVKFNPCDSGSIVSTGRNGVLFYRLVESAKESGLTCFVPTFSSKAFQQQPSGFTETCFVGNTTMAITSTLDGDLVVWDNRSLHNLSQQLPPGQYTVTKVVKVMPNCAITVVTVLSDSQIVVGGEDGNIKIFDTAFRLVLWIEKLKTGPVSSISFSSNAHGANASETSTRPLASEDHIPEVIVSTRHGRVLRIHNPPSMERADCAGLGYVELPMQPKNCPAMPKVEVILQSPFGKLGGISIHPSQPIFAVGANNGTVQIWNFATRRVTGTRKFEKAEAVDTYDDVQKRQRTDIIIDTLQVTALRYSSNGAYLAIGFANGQYKVVYADSLQDVPQFEGSVSTYAVETLAFDLSTSYLAIADEHQNICVIEKTAVARSDGAEQGTISQEFLENQDLEPTKTIQWSLVGKTRAHSRPIVGLEFFPSSQGSLCLCSVAKDQYVVVFDVQKSQAKEGLHVVLRQRISQTAVPTGLLRYAGLDSFSAAPFFLIPTSEGKFLLFNPETFVCRRTVLGPANSGGDVTGLSIIPNAGSYLAYMTESKVVGLAKLPLDGNPNRYTGIVAHPGKVKYIAASSDGHYLLTASETCASINLFSLNFSAVEAHFALGGEGLTPFLRLLDPSELGEESPLYKELYEYFYYAQLRAQGENTKDDREIGDTVDVSQIESLMQAVGYYPTKEECNNMICEVKYSEAESSNQIKSSLTFPELIKLYVNHRPINPLTEDSLFDALSKVQAVDYLVQGTVQDGAASVSKAGLVAALQQVGETMDQAELEEKLGGLMTLLNLENLGLEVPEAQSPMRQLPRQKIPESFTKEEFIKNVLGFESENSQAKPETNAVGAEDRQQPCL